MYLGAVDGTQRDRHGDEIAWLDPIFEVIAEDEWRRVDARLDFPPRGKVFWFRPSSAVTGALFFFDAQGPDRKQADHYSVSTTKPAYEVLDLRGLSDMDSVRRALVRGLKPPLATKAKRIYVLCKDDSLVGPLELTLEEDGLFHIGPHRERIPYYEPDTVDVREFKFGGKTRRVVASTKQPAPDGYVDWDPDDSVLIRALRFAAKTMQAGEEIGLTTRLLKEASERVAQGGGSADWFHRHYQFERALNFVESVRETQELAAVIVRELRKQPVIQRELDEEKTRLETAIRAQLDDELAATKNEIARLAEQKSSAEAELQELREDLDRHRESVEQQLQEIDEDLTRRLEDLLARPSKLFSEVAVFRALSSAVSARPSPADGPTEPSTNGSHGPLGPTPQSPTESGRDALRVEGFDDLKKRLRKAFKSRGLQPCAAKHLHSAVTGGVTPILMGPRAVDALDAYAQTVAGGLITWVRVGPGCLDLRDLFGHIEDGAFVPNESGLADACCQQAGDNPRLVVIDGANRAPLEGFLLSLLHLVRGLPGYGRLFRPSTLRATPEYAGLADLRWPSDLILAVTLTGGPTALPVPTELWAHGALIEIRDTPPKGDPPVTSQVSRKSACFQAAPLKLTNLLEMADELNLPYCGPTAIGFAAGYSRFDSDEAAVEREAEAAVLHPACATASWLSTEQLEAVLSQATKEAETQLRERLARLRRELG